MTITAIANRTTVILSFVTVAWTPTSGVLDALADAGFDWSPTIVRDTLHYLASEGRIERRKVGSSLQWRTVPEQVPHALDHLNAEAMNLGPDAHIAAVAEAVKTMAERLGVPLALLAPPSAKRAADLSDVLIALNEAEPETPELTHLHADILKRAIRRAAYDMGKALLDVLEGWIEGAQENCEALDHRSHGGDYGVCGKAFSPEDIRHMVNDAARMMGTREPYVEPQS